MNGQREKEKDTNIRTGVGACVCVEWVVNYIFNNLYICINILSYVVEVMTNLRDEHYHRDLVFKH